MKTSKIAKTAAFLVTAGLMMAPAAKADLTFTLDQAVGSVPAESSYGTVVLSQGAANTVNVTVTLNSGYTFVGGGAGYALGFDLDSGAGAATIASDSVVFNPSTANYTLLYAPPPLHADGSGDWQYAVDYTGPGASGNPPSSLSFSVVANSGTLTTADFVQNANLFYFVSDISVNGSTGDVVANSDSLAVVPEFSTVVAGASLMLPFGVSAMRILRKNRMA